MKKTILATLIAAASFGANATVADSPVKDNFTGGKACEAQYTSGGDYSCILETTDTNNTYVDEVFASDKEIANGRANVRNQTLSNDDGAYVEHKQLKVGGAKVGSVQHETKDGVYQEKQYIHIADTAVVKTTDEYGAVSYVVVNDGSVITPLPIEEDDTVIGKPVVPVVPIGDIPVTREDAIEYAKNTDLKNNGNFDKAVQYRMNNENKVNLSETLTTDQKLAAVNKQFATTDGQPKFSKVVSIDGEMGGVVLINNQTGEQYTQAQVDSMVVDAKAQIQQEAQKRAEVPPVDGELPPVDDIAPLPEVGIDEERVKEAVQNLVESGSNLVEAGESAKAQGQAYAAQQQAQIDEIYAQGQQNTSDIATLFNEVDRLDTRIDQTQALNAATVNARPMVTNGQTAFGAGVGYAGSEAAISVGVAHSFVDTGWSASGTLAASSDDVVIGAGTQYAF